MAFEGFKNYDVEDLLGCRRAFEKHFDTVAPDGTKAWTEEVLKWFERQGPAEVAVYSRFQDGEFMVDLCHLDFPRSVEASRRYAQAIAEKRCRMRLALECEWHPGKPVLDDAAKLACVRADVKVMVLGSSSEQEQEQMFLCLRRLREATADASPWLCLDVPWGVKDRGIGWQILSERGAFAQKGSAN